MPNTALHHTEIKLIELAEILLVRAIYSTLSHATIDVEVTSLPDHLVLK